MSTNSLFKSLLAGALILTGMVTFAQKTETTNPLLVGVCPTPGSISNRLLNSMQPSDHLDLSAPAGVCPMGVPVEKPIVSVSTVSCPMQQVA